MSGPLVPSNRQPAIAAPRADKNSPIPGLDRGVFVLLVVIVGLAFITSALTITYRWQQPSRRRAPHDSSLQLQGEGEAELTPVGSAEGEPQLHDMPRPDSTTLPNHEHMPISPRGLPITEEEVGSSAQPYGMSPRPTATSTNASQGGPESAYSAAGTSSWNMGTRTAVSISTPVSSPRFYREQFGSETATSPSVAILRPVTSSFLVLSMPTSVTANGKRPVRQEKNNLKSSPLPAPTSGSKGPRNRLRKPRPGGKGPSFRGAPPSPISLTAVMVRPSAGSMGNCVSWWDSSSDEATDSRKKKKEREG